MNSDCDDIVCMENERVVEHECETCPPGTTNASGDNAKDNANTNCDDVICNENERVVSNKCETCPPGTTNE